MMLGNSSIPSEIQKLSSKLGVDETEEIKVNDKHIVIIIFIFFNLIMSRRHWESNRCRNWIKQFENE